MNKFEVTVVSSKGQVVIPAAFREMLGIRPGTKLIMFSDGQNLLLKPMAPPTLSSFRRLLKKTAVMPKK